MGAKLGFRAAVFGVALIVLSLVGSSQAPANVPDRAIGAAAAAEIAGNDAHAKRLLKAGDYLGAWKAFVADADRAERLGALNLEADSLNSAGAIAVKRQDLRHALPELLRARSVAASVRDYRTSALVLNNLASLYLATGRVGSARDTALEGLALPQQYVRYRPQLQVQLARALALEGRFGDAVPVYRQAIDDLLDRGDVETTAAVLALFGESAMDAGRLDLAEDAFDQGLWLIRIHHLQGHFSVLRGLAKVRAREGDRPSANSLFDAALREPLRGPGFWMIYADRGEFRLSTSDPKGALADFEEARRLITLMRSDVVPADSDRVARESGGFSRVPLGLVEAGNRLALETGDRQYLQETFEAAEEDRMWSLRALVPSENDWRSRLPGNYWDLLAQYQAAEAVFLERHSGAMRARAASLDLELQHLEAAAQPDEPAAGSAGESSPLREAQHSLDSATVLFSFLVTARGGWLWAVDRTHADVYPIPAAPALRAEIDSFVRELRDGSAAAESSGRRIFGELFGPVPKSYLAHGKWLLELDGPLYDLPFAALPAGRDEKGPVYLVERAALQAIPGVLLGRSPDRNQQTGGLLAIGDAVYNAADERFPHAAASHIDARHTAALPRLPATADEVRECSRAWGTSDARILTGPDANLAAVEQTIQTWQPSIIHFATHVVSGPDQYSSGLIALSLNASGAMGLLGPAEIQARPVTAALVVLNGCHSDQGQALPASGLMGLTRAWIGSGAGAVLATRWEIPDDAGKALMADFYRQLRANWHAGPAWALQQAQLRLLKQGETGRTAALLGSYFLLGRI
ncbi:MAG TPA: CHAT domain-containing protein [Bryobacteraceae bacterium]|nr:CHAT domain-containing protein [Bryobacteraceae bacterium]